MPGSKNLDSFTDNAGKLVQFGIDYDDQLNALSFWCNNDTVQDAFARVWTINPDGSATGDTWDYVCPGKADDGDPVQRTVNTLLPHGAVLFQSPVNPAVFAGVVMAGTFPFTG